MREGAPTKGGTGDEPLRTYATYLVLLAIKGLSRLFFRFEIGWVAEPPAEPWEGIRILAILNHTSLFEPIFAGGAPRRLLWQIARHGVAPIATKTATRPLVGRFFRWVARDVVPITRERDETWEDLLARTGDPEAMVIILPEGRMRRRTGLDAHGEPLTMRGGIADILEAIPDGRMLLVYSGGLHHVHAPGDRFPRPFRTVRMCLEVLSIAEYRTARQDEGGAELSDFKHAVIRDFTQRRDRHCPTTPRTSALPPALRPADRRSVKLD